MANTGRVLVLTLKEVEDPGGTPTGNTKVNTVSDPDYIAPYDDTVLCPITYNTNCPVYYAATGLNDSIIFELSLDNAQVDNPALGFIKVKAMIGAVEQGNITFPLPNSTPNYFTSTISGLADSTAYDIEVDYLAPNTTLVTNCDLSLTITTN